MPRPRLCRRVFFQPDVNYFKPAGVRIINLEESTLTVDELEAVRLKDLLNLDQEKSAQKMKISQPTFHRLLTNARKKIADAIVNGKSIKIEGGNFKMVQPRARGFGRGYGRGFGKGPFRAGPSGKCICPKCGYKQTHAVGMPCNTIKCPKCGTIMTRE